MDRHWDENSIVSSDTMEFSLNYNSFKLVKLTTDQNFDGSWTQVLGL